MYGSVILCGGRSTRMGSPKEWLPLGGQTLLARIVDVVSQACSVNVIATSPGQSLPPLAEGCLLRADATEGLGPLSGFATGLAAMPDAVEAVFLTSCDAPFLKPELLHLLFSKLGTHDIAIPRIGGVLQPLAAAYRMHGLRDRVKPLLESGRRGVMDLLPLSAVCEVEENEIRGIDPDLRSFRNINTPEEYAEALELAGG
jgi:molybdopterin-guanine dinucleotide biosynthesis protein A